MNDHFDIFDEELEKINILDLDKSFDFLLDKKLLEFDLRSEEKNDKDIKDTNSAVEIPKTVTLRKKKNFVGGSIRKRHNVNKIDNVESIQVPPCKKIPPKIPADIQYSFYKASIKGRNDAKKIIKDFGLKISTFTPRSLDKNSKSSNECSTPIEASMKRQASLFPTKCYSTSKLFHKNEIERNSSEIKNLSCMEFESSDSSIRQQDETIKELLETPKMITASIQNVVPVSGVKKLAESPSLSLSLSTPTSTREKKIWSEQSSMEINNISDIQESSTSILNGVIAFIDVRTDLENRSQGVKDVLLSLGANVERYFTRKVNIVIFKDGRMSTFERAKSWNVPMVSLLWIEACRKEHKVVDKKLYPPIGIGKYEEDLPLHILSKKKTQKKITTKDGTTHQMKSKKKGLDKDKAIEFQNFEEPGTLAKISPSHEDKFIQMLLSMAGDEIKEFLSRPIKESIGETGGVPLSVHLLKKHFHERRAKTSIKDSIGSFEENKFSDKGRIRLRKLVFPSSSDEENDPMSNKVDRNNENDTNNIVKKTDIQESPSKVSQLLQKNLRKSAPAILFKAKRRQSAPAKILQKYLEKDNGIDLNTKAKNILQYFGNKDKNLNNVNNPNENELSQKDIDNRKSEDEVIAQPNEIEVLTNNEINKFQTILDGSLNNKNIIKENETHEIQMIPMTPPNKGTIRPSSKQKHKLLPIGSNIFINEPISPSTVSSPIKCPYIVTPERRKQNKQKLQTSSSHVDFTPNNRKQKSSKKICEVPTVFVKPFPSKNLDKENQDPNLITKPINNRGSSFFFVDVRGKKADHPKGPPTIVCTSMHRKDVSRISQLINQLGKFLLEKNVSDRTTHVITPTERRTINLVKGIARGAWILNDQWVYKSFESGKWLNEESFELVRFSSAVKESRIQRIAFGPEFSLDLFNKVGTIYVSKGTSPPTSDLVELLKLCGGSVVNNARLADIVVGSKPIQYDNDFIQVAEKWVLDSITSNAQLSPLLYQIVDYES